MILSTTVTVCVAVAVFPASSVAVHVTVVVPKEYGSDELFVVDATLQLSAVVAFPNTTLLAVHPLHLH